MATSKDRSKVPDMPYRDVQRQTIPVAEEEDLPPAYSEQHRTASIPLSTAHRQPQPRDPAPNFTASPSAPARADDPEGYLKTDPMHWDLKERRGDWNKYDHEPGMLCSSTGGVLCSQRGGVMCSDREGQFCSDRNGRFFSDRGGLWCADLGATLCSSGAHEPGTCRK